MPPAHWQQAWAAQPPPLPPAVPLHPIASPPCLLLIVTGLKGVVVASRLDLYLFHFEWGSRVWVHLLPICTYVCFRGLCVTAFFPNGTVVVLLGRVLCVCGH